MNKKRFTNIILIVVIVSIVVAGGYFVFAKQSSVTQTQIISHSNQTKPALSQENPPLQDRSNSTSISVIDKWEVVSVQEDGIQIVSDGNGATIEFFQDETHRTSGGCNEMMIGSYEMQPDSKLSVSIGGTKRKCAKDIVEFWDLNKVYAYKLTDNILFLYYKRESGVEGFFKLTRLTSNL